MVKPNSGGSFHSSRFERSAPEKQQRVLAAAVEEFAEHGFANANVNRIAALSGISVGSLYQYFATKEDLYLTVVNLGFSRLEEALTPVLQSSGSVLQKIEGIVDVLFEKTAVEQALTRLYNRFTTEGNSELARALATRLETISARAYTALLTQAKADGLMAKNADERAFAFCMDSIFLVLQFSLSGAYYRDRMEIYLGDDISLRKGFLKEQVLLFIKNALGGGRT